MALNLKEHSDEELIRLVYLGVHEAFAELVRKHVTTFYYVSLKLVKSKEDAEDIVQECFLKLWKSPQNFNEEKNVKFTTWFSKVVQNRSLDLLRKTKEDNLSEEFDVADNSKNQLEVVEENYQNQKLGSALQKLKGKEQQAIKLSFFENRKNSESAKIMNLSLQAFQSLLMRSKESLRVILKNEL